MQDWSERDHRGHPIGDLCKVHGFVVKIGYAHMSKADVISRYHSDKMFKAELHGACSVMLVLIQTDQVPAILPMSTTSVKREFRVEYSFDLLFVTESDLLKIFGQGARKLGLKKPVQICLEDGSGFVSGFHMSPTGVPESVRAGLRHCKVSTTLTHAQDDELVNGRTQCRKDQAKDILDMVLAAASAEKPSGEKCSGLASC